MRTPLLELVPSLFNRRRSLCDHVKGGLNCHPCAWGAGARGNKVINQLIIFDLLSNQLVLLPVINHLGNF